ncbi:mechanosensitive ion channel family protein [Testudinibacter sp. TR-2022]|uniref:mechanosensitive ion channel family protein n=1 Tax=Testudinibacter sp. TR-2022 TaxID=2585029 RepID=UPI00111B1AE1|nr:mechanosensitive ion channel family protein [Testudinibacter sp. TR-2022]TNH08833.1 mechanosensitive ion channel family protein [Pasteurellaceae bacterium Phil11]TNH25879.1 mechanosensitive ion channel family protein [Testudinibacter sp. TR-2022]TNH28458.1 mechanosensitive ion channel family protein [Testudinibacter sp. TR-2022]
MREQLLQWLSGQNYPNSELVVNLVMISLIVLTTLLLHTLIHYVLFRVLINKLRTSRLLFLNILAEHRLFNNLALTIQGLLLVVQLRIWLPENVWREGFIAVTHIWCLIFALFSVFSLLDTLQTYLFRRNLAQHFPVRGLVQTIKLLASIAIGILLISLILGQSPLILLSGLGAMTAVLMLVFKDPILGLVAGIQLSANRMLNVGDWLEMPKYGADGSVVDIGLTTVKVRNWDNTVTTLPTYALISDSFKNWRAMSESGGRRIKRAVYLDSNSVHFLNAEEIAHLQQSRLLNDYLDKRQQDIREFHQTNHIDHNSYLNGRHLTNLGTFRVYLQQYLHTNRHIRKDMTLMVRQLDASDKGIPLEIYCFTNTVLWGEYEGIQADIFDHIYAVAKEFKLRIYQAPSGYDMRRMGRDD